MFHKPTLSLNLLLFIFTARSQPQAQEELPATFALQAGETLLPAGRYRQFQWFVGPDGLYIAQQQINNPPQPADGDKLPTPALSFTRFELVANQ